MNGNIARRFAKRSFAPLFVILSMVVQLAAPLVPVAKAVELPLWSSVVWSTPNSCVSDTADESPSNIDIIGGDISNPAVGFFTDSNFLYFREKVNGNPGTAGDLAERSWVVLFQTAKPKYQYLLSVTGKSTPETNKNEVQLWKNTIVGDDLDFNPSLFNDKAETLLWHAQSADYARVTSAAGGAFYIDWAIPKIQLISTGITANTTKYFATSTDSNNYNKDHLNCYSMISDLSIEKTASSETAAVGDNLTYTLKVFNNGPENASGVVVTDFLPTSMTYVSSTGTIGSYESSTGKWNIGTLNNSASETLDIITTVNSAEIPSVINSASVASTNPDSNESNNVSTFNTSIIARTNNPPVANDQDVSIDEDTLATVTMTADDIDGDTLSYYTLALPTYGTLGLVTGDSVIYTPNPNYNGTDSFTFKASDGKDYSNIATITINVEARNDAPVARDDFYNSAIEDTTLSKSAGEGVLNNDSDIDGDLLTVVLVADVAHGVLTLNLDGSFDYTPATDFHGEDLFTYKANDGTEDSNIATVTIGVLSENDFPVANADDYNTNEDIDLNISAPGVLANDTDADGDSLTATVVDIPLHGTLTLNLDGSFNYNPELNYHGLDQFTYVANDGTANSGEAIVKITVNPVNDVPVANPNEITTDEDTAVLGGVFASDADADPLTFSPVEKPVNGTLVLNADGTFVYTPNPNYSGPDSFTFKANDGTEDSNIATVDITVRPVNDAPVAVDNTYSTSEDVTLSVLVDDGVLKNDSDVDSSSLTAELISNVSNGLLTLNANGSFTYDPNPNFKGTDSFTYVANDGSEINGSSNVATVTINVGDVNDAPVANDQNVSIDEDTSAIVTMTATDADGDTLTYSIVASPSNGTLSGISDGNKVTYTPNANYFGPDSFTYKANDGTEDSKIATVTITVVSVNDAPVIVLLGASSMSLTQGGTFTDPGATANDVEDGDLTESIIVSGTVNTNTASTYYVNYSVTDSGEKTAQATRTVVVNPKGTSGGGGGGTSSGGGGGAMIVKPTIIITNESVSNLGGGKAKVTWTTNIETTEQVVYGDNSVVTLGTAPSYGYDFVTSESDYMVKEHSVIVSGLVSGTTYYFRPVADRLGSTGEVVGKEVFYMMYVIDEGQVKGISDTAPAPSVPCIYLLEYIKLGANNNPDEVKKLEIFLNQFEGENLIVNGIYEKADFDAVSRFQEKYMANILSPWKHNEATGFVYITTKKQINELYCQREFVLSPQQLAEIASFVSRLSGTGNAGIYGTESSTSSTTTESGAGTDNSQENAPAGDDTEDLSGVVKGASKEVLENGNDGQAEAGEQAQDQSMFGAAIGSIYSALAGNILLSLILASLLLTAIYYFIKKQKGEEGSK